MAMLLLSPVLARNQTTAALRGETLETAVRAATLVAVPKATDATIYVSPITQVEGWAFGTSGVVPQDVNSGTPSILLFLAQQEADGWNVAIEHTEAFEDALARAPRLLLTTEQRATMTTAVQPQGNGSMQLSLPWAPGETQNFSGGPHSNGWTTVRDSIDFSGGSFIVRPAREGVAYVPCGTASDYVRVDHGGGLVTHYYHLSAISITNGQAVTRSTAIGRQSNNASCLEGRSDGAHVHFWITQNNQPVAIDGIDIGGWTVSAGADPYDGCMTRVRDGLRLCVLPGKPNCICQAKS
jgi:hypothetical protein